MSKWAGEFGVEYTNRQKIDTALRYQLFKALLDGLFPYSCLEVGANAGHNLESFGTKVICPIGIEINKSVASRSKFPIVIGSAYDIPFPDNQFDLVFTAGVLIHLEDHKKAMDEIFRVSKKYIMSIEYMSEIEEKIEYRDGVYCAAKPFDKYWEKYPLKLVKKGKMSDFGIDDGTDFSRTCKYIILEK